MQLTELLYQINERGIFLWVEQQEGVEDKLKFSIRQPLADKDQWLAKIKPHKTELIALLKGAGVLSDSLQLPVIYPTNQQPFVLSFAQKRLWFLQQFEPDSAAYNVPLILEMQNGNSTQNAVAAEQALVAVLERHQVLRTVLIRQSAEPVGVLKAATELEFNHQILHPELDQDALHHLLRQELSRPFVLEQQLPVRACYYQRPDHKAILLITLHHIAVDGWSLPCLLHEFQQFYLHFSQGTPVQLAPLTLQYQDFAWWQQRLLQGELQQQQWQFWQHQLSDVQTLELPLDRPRPATFDAKGDTVKLQLDSSTSESLHQLARSLGCSFYALTLSAYFVLLHKYSQQNDLLIGTAAANRHYPGTSDMIGFFVNSLAIRCQTRADISLTELVRSVHQSLISAQQYQDMPFDLLVEKLQLPRDPSCHPLFQVFFAVQQADEQAQQQEFSLLTPEGLYQVAKYDLSLFITEAKDGLTLELNYATALFDQSTVAQMLAHYQTVLKLLLAKPTLPLNQLQLLSQPQQQHLLLELNDTAKALPDVSSVTALFSHQVSLTPQHRALSFVSDSLSYQQLDQRSTELALMLRPLLEASPSKLVALLMLRSLELIVAILAIHKAGGAYVPVAAEFPLERQDYILKDTQAAALISHQALRHKVTALSGSTPVLWADTGLWHQPAPEVPAPENRAQQHSLPDKIDGDQLAYIIYTSGTTGNPKGVMLEHQHLLNRIDWMQNTYPLTASDKVLQKTPYIFDVSVWELLWANAYGAEIVLAEPEGHKDPDYLYQLIEQQQITVLHFVPTMFQAFLDDLQRRGRIIPSSLRYIFCSGEALPVATVQQFQQLDQQQNTQLHNLYGPTETAIDSSYFYCQGELRCVPIGKPIQNTQLYILDNNQQLVPKGVAGELYIAGHGVARGYLNLPELTAERFLANPFYHATDNAQAGRRMYKTGDRVRMRADGNIEYLGRNDFQVKLRGFRIELGEIEAALCALPQISQALVMVKQASGQDQLVAYCQTEAMPEADQLRALLLKKLPDYMVPEHFIGLSRFPVNVNGKLDRKALPEPELKTEQYVAPATEQEKQLCALWQQVLKLDKVGVEDDFFRLGGNSILAISVSHAMAELLQAHYPVARLFADKNIRNALLNIKQNSNLSLKQNSQQQRAIQPCFLAEPSLSFAQQRLWFLHQYDAGNTAYNIPVALQVQTGSALQLQQSLTLLVERHQVLRSLIRQKDEQAHLLLQTTDSFRLETLKLADDEFAETFKRCVNYCFNLEQDIPIKAWCFELTSGQNIENTKNTVLLINIHHSAFDGWSHGLFMAELEQAMHHFCKGQPLQLAQLPLQYQDYGHWQRQAFAEGQFDSQLNYWQQQLHQLSPLQMPLDKPRPAKLSYAGDNLLFQFPAALTTKLKALAAARGCTLYSLMLSGFAVLLHKYCGQQDILVGTPFANRHHQHTEQLIGFFVNTLPLRLQIQPDQSAEQWLEHVVARVTEAQLNQDLPFEYLIDLLKLQPDQSRHPVFQLLFSMDQFEDTAQSDYFSAFDLGETYQVAKYDLSLYIKDEGEELLGALNFSTALFNKNTMQRLTERYLVLMQQIAEQPQTKIAQLQWFSAADQRVLSETKAAAPEHNSASFAGLFYQQAAQRPTQQALVWQNHSWTYQQLDQESNQLAHQLRQQGCDRGDLVALLLPRGPELILSILAILKAGAAYVPISPDYPLQRIQFMLQDAKCRLLLTDRTDLATEVELYNPASNRHHNQPKTALALYASSTDLAYVIYTSGTTGQPKGVMIEQHSFTDFLLNFPLYIPDDQQVQLLSLTSVTFDIFGLEYGLPLLRGGTLYLSDLQNAVPDLQRHPQINMLQQTPSVLRTLLAMQGADFSAVTCLVGGEALDHDLLQQLQQQFTQVVNVYGPTETVIWSTCHLYNNNTDNNPLLIGNALPHEQIYVLDSELQFLPSGVIGELFIGGAGLARGYLNRPELTAERFIIHPQSQQRLYKTGDLVKQRLDGQLEYKGRTDFQVKIRGHRIELAEIESTLQQDSRIHQALVLAVQEQQSDAYLLAYYQADSELSAEQLTEIVARYLPDYMWPEVYIRVEQFSLTANGKLDRAALPKPRRDQTAAAEYQAPTTAFEQQICQIWQQVLELDLVGLTDDFFRLGGNSMKALLLCHKLAKEAAWPLAVADLFHYRTIAALIKYCRSNSTGKQQHLPVSEPDNHRAPLSFSQNRLWFLYKLEPQSTAYHIPMLLQLKTLDVARLQQAFTGLVQHQQLLCSVIEEHEGKAWQQLVSVERFHLAYHQLKAAQLPEQIQAAVQMPFVLEAQLPIRATVFELDDGTYYLLILLHHIAFDGWSMDLLFSQLDTLYQQQNHTLPPLDYQYRDYARWQQQKPVALEQNPYWQNLNQVPPLDLRPCYPRPKTFDYQGADYHFSLGQSLSAQVQALAKQQQVSVYSLLLSVWSLTLHKLTGQQDILLGTPMANRQLPGSDALIGFFVNTQVLHHSIHPKADFPALLAQVSRQNTEAQRYQHLPFEQLLEQLSIERDASRHPLFQVMFSVQTFAEKASTLDWLSPAPLPAGGCTAKYDLSLQLELRDQQISGVLNYASSLFSEKRIVLIQQGFVNLLQQVVDSPQSQNSQLSLLTTEQKLAMLALGDRQQTHSDKNSAKEYNTTLNALFALQVAAYPQQIAVQLDDQQLTYAELDALSSQLAHQLVQLAGEKQQMIALLLPRSIWMIVAILAVLKTGSAWVPVEPATPSQRLQHILKDTEAKLVLSLSDACQHGQQDLPEQCQMLYLDQLDLSQQARTAPGILLSERDLAYVIYTSGTTGVPKGVLIEHQSVLNTVLQQRQRYQTGPGSVLYLGLSYAFDAAVAVIMNALLSGAKLLLSKEIDFNQPSMHNVSHLILSGAVLDLLQPDCFPKLKYLIYGGAAASSAALQRFSHVEIYAEYGVTEAAITSSLAKVDLTQPAGIGLPLNHISLYVLDSELEPVPVEVTGELYIGGVAVARGYLNQPELNLVSFIPSPFIAGDRLYKTGDLVRWHQGDKDNCQLVFQGRKDKQLKLRGYRIELAEIEQQLLSHKDVQQVALKLHQVNGRDQLLAYLVSSKPDIEPIVAELKPRLADFMQPDHWLWLPQLPLTSNGKLDEAALPLPQLQHGYICPATPTEKQLAMLWQQLLGDVTVGRNDDFFQSGGDSILVMQLAALLKKAGWHCTVKNLMQHRSLKAMALLLDQQQEQQEMIAEQGQLSGSFELLPIQHWFFDLVQSGQIANQNHWNQSFLLKVQPLKPELLLQAARQLVMHHDMLRVRFSRTADGYQQSYLADLPQFHIEQLDRSAVTEEELEQQLSKWQSQFDIEQGPLFKLAYLYNYPDQSARLFFACHHLLIDAVSWRLLVEDLKALYQQQQLPEKTSSYRQWVAEQQAAPQLYPAFYWQAFCAALPEIKKPAITNSTQAQLQLTKEQSKVLMQQAHLAYQTEINELLLSALALALRDIWGNTDQAVLLESHGRQTTNSSLNLNRTLGWFTSFYPVLLAATDDLAHNIHYNKETLRRASGYGQSYISSGCYRQAKAKQLAVSFNYLGQINAGNAADDWQILAESSGANYPSQQDALDPVSILAVFQDQQLRFSCTSLYGQQFSDQLAHCLEQRLQQLIDHCLQHKGPVLPSLCDYPQFAPYQLHQGEQANTVFVFPPGEGDSVDFYQPLLQKLPNTRVVLFNNFYRYLAEQHAGQAALTSFTELAQQLIPLIKHLQPQGPWHFVGWSFGGVLALEVCRLLEKQQQTPGSVQLIDSYFSLNKARLGSPELDTLLVSYDSSQNINARHLPSTQVQSKVRLYKASCPSGGKLAENLQLLEQAYLRTPANFIEDFAAKVEVVPYQAGHFDPLTTELAEALVLGVAAGLGTASP
ncbi:non-ribosomal peptide synthetase [Rheinheimera soli]|uniref:Amino acid adenylation domain-containing protein/non-ribosomal peptide synthase protein (TIGR01720 family) n=1 Tax=Rheinheimera soli TaxID=443616 RepID=A0ABU1VWD1_9GAMM|nr:non-ribosomal peptide synthetase [Rheinheimera soli]MDR7119693.1 amino acid adenylation domain-containing protein/non-ribosomal peptide synthase protein (TIGR01720 family) [Rheinheimera soli]